MIAERAAQDQRSLYYAGDLFDCNSRKHLINFAVCQPVESVALMNSLNAASSIGFAGRCQRWAVKPTTVPF